MKKQRVDIELDENILKWAAIEAAKLGISRRKFLSKLIIDGKISRQAVKNIAQQQPKCSSNE